jgi:hypothetical protein
MVNVFSYKKYEGIKSKGAFNSFLFVETQSLYILFELGMKELKGMKELLLIPNSFE